MSERITQSGVTAVAINDRALMIEGIPGSGKSSLALSLIDRGARLIGDDGISLERRGNHIQLLPPSNITGMLEIRGVGIAQMEAVSAPLALILAIQAEPPRLPEMIETVDVLGCSIPQLGFQMDGINQAARAEWALRMHGLTF